MQWASTIKMQGTGNWVYIQALLPPMSSFCILYTCLSLNTYTEAQHCQNVRGRELDLPVQVLLPLIYDFFQCKGPVQSKCKGPALSKCEGQGTRSTNSNTLKPSTASSPLTTSFDAKG